MDRGASWRRARLVAAQALARSPGARDRAARELRLPSAAYPGFATFLCRLRVVVAAGCARDLAGPPGAAPWCRRTSLLHRRDAVSLHRVPVSYTHLTLPTSDLV